MAEVYELKGFFLFSGHFVHKNHGQILYGF